MDLQHGITSAHLQQAAVRATALQHAVAARLLHPAQLLLRLMQARVPAHDRQTSRRFNNHLESQR